MDLRQVFLTAAAAAVDVAAVTEVAAVVGSSGQNLRPATLVPRGANHQGSSEQVEEL